MKHLIFLLILIPQLVLSQSKNGYYMNWNRDHTGRTIKPMIPISKEDAQKINCYWVEFDSENRFRSVKYFNAGKPSKYSNYDAHELIRNYYPDKFEDTFRDSNGEDVLNDSGIKKYSYQLNSEGYWISMEKYGGNNKLAEENGVSTIKVTRDYQNKILTEIQLNLKKDTIPDPNGFKIVHFTYDKNSYMTARINKDKLGKLKDAKQGYAIVVFQFDHNGMFFGEEFRNEDGGLVVHPDLGYAKIDFREFNEYGKSKRQYFIDESGYPSKNKAMAIIEYNNNMARKKYVIYDRVGKLTESEKGISSILYEYEKDGKFSGRKYYNLKNELVE